MKNNTSLIVNVVLGIAVIGLYILYFTSGSKQSTTSNTDKPKTEEKTKAKENTSKGEIKIAYVNSDTLLSKYEYYKTAKKDLETKGRIIQSDVQKRGNAFQNELLSYQKSANTMTQQQIQDKEKSLAAKQQELQLYQRDQEESYLKVEQETMKKLSDNIREFLDKYAKEKGYTFIFGYSEANLTIGLIQTDKAYDITAEVIEGLNDEYKAGQKKDK